MILAFNIFLTNIFLNDEFLSYAPNVLMFGKQHQDLMFPKLSKCDFYK